MRRLPLLTTSAAKQYRACPRHYWFSHEEGYRVATVDPNRAFGTLGHHGLEAWWRAAQSDPSDRDAWLRAALRAVYDCEYKDPFAEERAIAMLAGYHARWCDEPLEVLAVERQFETELRNPATGATSKTWRFAGKIDAIVRLDGEVWIVEHKTSAEDFSAGSEYRTRLLLDHQVSNYIAGARSLGLDPKGCIYDVLGKPRHKPYTATPVELQNWTKPTKKNPEPRLYANQRLEDETPENYGQRVAAAIAESPDQYYARFPVVRLADEEREAGFDMWQAAAQIRESRNMRAWPRNPDACKRYGRACDFLAVCTGQASLEDTTRYRRAERQHEELEGDEAA